LPFNFLLGTLPGLVPIFKESPRDAHPTPVITLLYRKLNLSGLYFMDNWPAAPYRQMVIVDPVSCDNTNIVALAILIL
jgi:hypothetical protein